jgi:hypothetical protein
MSLQSGVTVATAPGWCVGPAPFEIRRNVVGGGSYQEFVDDASVVERSRHVSPTLRARLYAPENRWHRAASECDQFSKWAGQRGSTDAQEGPHVLALELLGFPSATGGRDGVLIVHARLEPGQLDPLAAMQLLKLRTAESREWIEHLLRGVGRCGAEGRRPYHLCFAQPSVSLPARDKTTQAACWSADEQWLWLLSTLQDERAYPVSDRNREQLIEARRALSADWTCAVMRAGTAFLARPLSDDWEWQASSRRFELSFLSETAPLLVRSLYTDAIAIGVVKGVLLDDFAQELAALEDPIAHAAELIVLESAYTRFRNTLWWQDTGLSGHATMLLRKYDAAHNHKDSFERLVADFSDYSQKVERTELQRANEISQGSTALIGLLSCFGVPLATLQVFGTESVAVWVLVAAYLALFGLLPTGGQIIGLNLPTRWRTATGPGRVAGAAWVVFWVALIGGLLVAGVLPTG